MSEPVRDEEADTADHRLRGILLKDTRKSFTFAKTCLSLSAVLFTAYLFISIVLSLKGSALPSSNGNDHRLPSKQIDFTKDGCFKVSFENVRNGTFQPEMKPLQWISTPDSQKDDKGLYVTFQDDTYSVRSVLDESYSHSLFEGTSFIYENNNYTVDAVVASPNLGKVLIRSETEKGWRHSTVGTYFVYENETFHKINTKISIAKWSPTSENIAYVRHNDLYMYSASTYKTSKRITSDGSELIFNGKPDWVYEEEVLEGDTALWWSPRGEYLAFFKINETGVQEFPIPFFVQDNQTDPAYPELQKIKYPKSGSTNPIAKLNVFDLASDKVSSVDSTADESLITEVAWVGNHEIIAKTTDRSSDILTVVTVDAADGARSKASRVEKSKGGWWEITHKTIFVPRDKSRSRFFNGYIDLVPVGGFNHLVYFTTNSTGEVDGLKLTSGDWEVVNGPAAFDEDSSRVYFIATKKCSTERHVYYVDLGKPEDVYALTDETADGYYSASFSAGARFLLLNYLGPDVPYQKIIDLKSHTTDKKVRGNIFGETLYYLNKNEKLHDTLKPYAIPSKSFRELTLGKDENGSDIIVNSYEILPNDFDPSLKNHYPVFFFAYGGPNSQQVAKLFGVGFNQVIASQLDAIVVVVDGRGTGFRGKEFRFMVRDNLGDVESTDQILAAKLYGEKPYVNKEKISLFGWSYGGFLTLKTLEKDAGEHFKYGVAVAPVTDWLLYDSVYTERYMHTPQNNPEGYENSKVHNTTALSMVPRFLLIHGTGDDNVHFQNSLKFLDLLNLGNVENYDVHIFPDSDHSIRYHNANLLVYNKILNWIRHAYNGDFLL
ncbi:unnamed protein product [Kluyveromyces dobzhanskii CBS 2104]|uniref:WGS project CCBQ000000000 data, contig 00014 n=1 Tax=Kluyveromyces dobzhanskii CBS 2104 TaxID=1427455 RepID=A0A0A8L9B4_9SACH|nr:unnamed protein product [Kluyveromyces dobzhanskii CBS 2104]